ncbi:hypothetical protein CCACVL1_03467 [Corchorus capsularis]|uniref:Uncharacterized protein n=1 Tax=Corchorus capsularis TaxID=210143 RepID=A0A1R3JZ17_COCAP|nr:hypothetical protein CCACVL1_03467 [Corchorus capsularis]
MVVDGKEHFASSSSPNHDESFFAYSARYGVATTLRTTDLRRRNLRHPQQPYQS